MSAQVQTPAGQTPRGLQERLCEPSYTDIFDNGAASAEDHGQQDSRWSQEGRGVGVEPLGLHRVVRSVTHPQTVGRLLPGRVRPRAEHVELRSFHFIFLFRECEESEEAHAHGPYGRDCRRDEGSRAYAQEVPRVGSDVAR